MSLNAQQRLDTSRELAQNLALSGLTAEQLGHRMGWTDARVQRTLRVDGGSPADVWKLRDALVSAVREAGREPAAFSVLTEQKRRDAGLWFGVDQDAPH